MKRLITPLLLIVILLLPVGCGSGSSEPAPAPDISDIIMTPALQKVFAQRREALLDSIGDGVVLLMSDYGYDGGRDEYRVASNFWYLTGYGEPGALISLSGADGGCYAFYTRPRSVREIIYSGNLPDQAELIAGWAPDTVIDSREYDKLIADALKEGRTLYLDFRDAQFRSRVAGIAGRMNAPATLLKDIGPVLAEMRIFKDEYELMLLQKAVDITGESLHAALRACRPGMYEFEIEALLEYVWRRNGSSMPGFESIVGSGENAVTLHYGANNRRMEDGDLLLMDIGAEYGYYTADITRTIPVNGIFTREQRDIYDLVLRAQKAAIAEMKPGAGMTAMHRRATEVLMEGLYDLGLATDPTSQWQRKFYTIYHICHYLGLDVHDAGSAGIPPEMAGTYLTADTVVGRPLLPGMVLTVEPGIYLRANGLDQLKMLYGREVADEEIDEFLERVAPVYERYKNIGVRIEDDVFITATGNVVLSAAIPKEPEEIEKVMRGAL